MLAFRKRLQKEYEVRAAPPPTGHISAKPTGVTQGAWPDLLLSLPVSVPACRVPLQQVNVSVNDVIIRSAALALRDVPEANAFWDRYGERPAVMASYRPLVHLQACQPLDLL